MGPNGSGKSTLAQVLAGKDDYDITQGQVLYKGKDLLDLDPNERACEGLFLAFQYPVEIPGVSSMQFLKAAVNAKREYHGLDELDGVQLLQLFREKAEMVNVNMEMVKRNVNEGFLGWREEALRDLPDGRARFGVRHPRRNRLRPGHRRAAHRQRGRDQHA